MRVGLDIGSTTIKCVVLGEHDELLYSTYERHYSHILEKAQELLRRIDAEQLHLRSDGHFSLQEFPVPLLHALHKELQQPVLCHLQYRGHKAFRL